MSWSCQTSLVKFDLFEERNGLDAAIGTGQAEHHFKQRDDERPLWECDVWTGKYLTEMGGLLKTKKAKSLRLEFEKQPGVQNSSSIESKQHELNIEINTNLDNVCDALSQLADSHCKDLPYNLPEMRSLWVILSKRVTCSVFHFLKRSFVWCVKDSI